MSNKALGTIGNLREQAVWVENSKDRKMALLVFYCECMFTVIYILSYDVASGSEITPCNKINKPLVVYRLEVYRFTGNVMTPITTLHTL